MPKNVISVSLIWHLSKLKKVHVAARLTLGCAGLHPALVFLSRPVYCNVISNTNLSWAFLKNKVHLVLENTLVNSQSEMKTSKSESPKWAVQGWNLRGLFIQHYRPVTIAGN